MAKKSISPAQGALLASVSGFSGVLDDPKFMTEEFATGPFSPGMPFRPTLDATAQGLDARTFDFQTGWNLSITPRTEQNPARPFRLMPVELRRLSRRYSLVRIVLETRKAQLRAQKWAVQPKESSGIDQNSPVVKYAQKMMECPDGQTNFSDWFNYILEDQLVLDQVVIRVDRNVFGTPVAFRNIDPGTIKMYLDKNGERPKPPFQAYAQNIKGMPACWYTQDELMVRSFNASTDWPYGYSPIEQIANLVELGVAREQSQLDFYKEGSMPDSLITTPKGWTPQNIGDFQQSWDNLFTGPNAVRLKRKVQFLPAESQLIQSQTPVLKDETDEWLARQICYAFNVSPAALTKENNSRANGETLDAQNLREGLTPLLNWYKQLFDDMLQIAGFDKLEFNWVEEEAEDPLEKAQIETQLVGKIKTVNESRQAFNLPPIEGGDVLALPGSQPQPGMNQGAQDPGMNNFMSIFGKQNRSYTKKMTCKHEH